MPPSLRTLFRAALIVTGFHALGLLPVALAQTPKDDEEFEAARALLVKGDAKGAELAFGKMAERLPEDVGVFFNRARARSLQQNFQGAIDDLDVVISLMPQQPAGYLQRAVNRSALNKYAGAEADASIAVRLAGKDDPQPLMIRAQLRGNWFRWQDAAADYTAVLAIDERHADARFARADLQLHLLGDIGQAQADLLRLAKDLPGDAGVQRNLGEAEFDLMHFDAALQALQRSDRLEPKSRDTHLTWGRLLFAQGDFNGALLHFREALAADPSQNAYPQLMIYLAQRRSGKPAPELEGALDAMENLWVRSVGHFFLGITDDDLLLRNARGTMTNSLKNGRICEAYFYIGQARLLAGDRIAAKALFQEAAATKAATTPEYTLARAELAR